MKDGGLNPWYHFRYRPEAVALTQPENPIAHLCNGRTRRGLLNERSACCWRGEQTQVLLPLFSYRGSL